MKRTLMLFGASALLAAAQPVSAQDPVKLSPKLYTVLLENDQVRVLEFRANAGQKEPTHSHPSAVIYALADGKARLTTPDGKSEVRELKAGTAIWSEAVIHAYENIAPTESHVVIIEMKGAAAAASSSGNTGSKPSN